MANDELSIDTLDQAAGGFAVLMDEMRLQMVMDRETKMMSTLSNILKKISDTAQSITQNLK